MVFRLFVLLFQLVDLLLSVIEGASRLLRIHCGGLGGEGSKEEPNHAWMALILCCALIYYMFTTACPGILLYTHLSYLSNKV